MTWGFEVAVPIRDARRRNIGLRLLGIFALLMGSAHFAIGCALLMGAMAPNPGESRWYGLIGVGGGGLFMLIGWWLCRRRPYRPDLGDVHPLLKKSAGYSDGYDGPSGPRRWWTGDPISETRARDA